MTKTPNDNGYIEVPLTQLTVVPPLYQINAKTLMFSVNSFNQRIKSGRVIFGEFNQPELQWDELHNAFNIRTMRSTIDRAALQVGIIKCLVPGNDTTKVLGEIKLLKTPYGEMVERLLKEDKVRFVIRALRTISENPLKDFTILTIDAVENSKL